MNTSIQLSRFEELCAHVGGGNPTGGIWIIGIEEGGAWDNEPQIDAFIVARKGRGYDWRQPGDEEIPGWRISPAVSKICCGITGLYDSWEDFRRRDYLTAGGPLFMTNLYPLAKPMSGSVPREYSAWFGIKDAADYKQQVGRSGRLIRLKDLWTNSDPKITICHGKGSWHEYRELLELDQPTHVSSDAAIERYSRGIFLTPHLSWSTHMPSRRIDALIDMGRPLWRSNC